jgi:hypothetical protein
MSAALYQPVYLIALAVLCLTFGLRYASSRGYELQEEGSSMLLPIVIGTVLIFWLGNRPLSGYYFGDTSTYALSYIGNDGGSVNADWSREWVWALLVSSCRTAGLSVSWFFTVVEAGYVVVALWAVKRMMPDNTLLGTLFVISSLSYYSYGINGIRNGLACHIIILGISFLADRKYMLCAVLFLTALGIHRSTMLPIAASVAGAFFLKSPKYAVYAWMTSIFVSLLAGGVVTSFFASLGLDDRMNSYIDTSNDMSGFSKTGFRWDFLLYSAMPVLMIWYICVKRQVSDTWYDLIATVYCLSNAFWIMVIRSSFSNRFAYLSWFIYPIVIAYPLANLEVWDDQDKKIGAILLTYCGFTVFMQAVYW